MSSKNTASDHNQQAALADLECSGRDKPSKRTLGAELDLLILLAETPEQCVDISWDRMPPVGLEI